MGTLTDLEQAGPARALRGRALWCGLYVNELLLRLLERDDPHPEVYDACGRVLTGLADADQPQSLLLRRFELALLTGMGVAPDFGFDAASGEPIVADGLYHLQPDVGFLAVDRPGADVYRGEVVQAVSRGFTSERDTAREMRELMRSLIDHQLGGRPLASRRLLAGAAASKPIGGKS